MSTPTEEGKLPLCVVPTRCPSCDKNWLDNLGRCGSCNHGWSYAMENHQNDGRLVGPERGETPGAITWTKDPPFLRLTAVVKHLQSAWEILENEPEDGFRDVGKAIYTALSQAQEEQRTFQRALDYQRRGLL